MSEFLDIMEESHDSIKITDKTEWWQSRWKLDDRLRVRLTQILDKFSTKSEQVDGVVSKGYSSKKSNPP